MKIFARFILVLALMLTAWACSSPEAENESKFADYQEMPVHYVDKGGDGPVVIFVHGWSCNSGFWRHQADALSDDFRVLLVDLPGHGDSGKPEIEYTIPLFGGAVLAVMDHAGVDKAVLAGHSMGFPVVREAWRMAPSRVGALISVDGAMLELPEDPAEKEQRQKENEAFLERFEGPGYQEFVRRFVGSMHDEQTPAEIREQVVAWMLETPDYVGRSAMRNFADPAVWKEDVVDAPVLAVYADMPWLEPDFETKMRRLFPDFTYRKMSGVGHFLMLEKPDELNAILRDFLAKL